MALPVILFFRRRRIVVRGECSFFPGGVERQGMCATHAVQSTALRPFWKDGGAIMEGWASLSGLADKQLEGGLDALEADLAPIAAEDVAFR